MWQLGGLALTADRALLLLASGLPRHATLAILLLSPLGPNRTGLVFVHSQLWPPPGDYKSPPGGNPRGTRCPGRPQPSIAVSKQTLWPASHGCSGRASRFRPMHLNDCKSQVAKALHSADVTAAFEKPPP